MKVPEADHQLKVPVVRREAYTAYLEQATPKHTFLHCDVHGRWTPKVRAQMLADWETLKGLHGGPFFAVHDPADHKHHKFLTMLGFKWAASFSDRLHRRRQIYQSH